MGQNAIADFERLLLGSAGFVGLEGAAGLRLKRMDVEMFQKIDSLLTHTLEQHLLGRPMEQDAPGGVALIGIHLF